MGIENPVHIMFLAVVALIVLGPKRLPELARAAGKGMREFRESLNGETMTGEATGGPPFGQSVAQAPLTQQTLPTQQAPPAQQAAVSQQAPSARQSALAQQAPPAQQGALGQQAPLVPQAPLVQWAPEPQQAPTVQGAEPAAPDAPDAV